MDEAQLIEDALAYLRDLRRQNPGTRAEEMAFEIMQEIEGRRMAFDSAGRLQRLYSDIAKGFAEAASTLGDDNYETPIFKCLRDFEKCIKRNSDRRLCWATYVLCVRYQLEH